MLKKLNPIVKCADGSEFSIQASKHHYCEPRNDEGPYLSVEIYIKSPIPWEFSSEMYKYHDGAGVYAYVPMNLIRDLIKHHGGIIEGKLP